MFRVPVESSHFSAAVSTLQTNKTKHFIMTACQFWLIVCSQKSSPSSQSLASFSGHSADGNAGDEESDSEQDRTPAVAAASGPQVGAKGAGGRVVKKDYNKRTDVGCIGILSGNWGGNRTAAAVQRHMNDDLRRGPATIIILQEAHPDVIETLSSPSVEGEASADNVLDRRSAYQYSCLRGNEDGNSLLVAGRSTVVDSVEKIKWVKRLDGHYTKKKVTKNAFTRIFVVNVAFRNPVCGHADLAICNVHFHHLTAKKESGFARSHDSFWVELADICKGANVRILAGDFNMAIFQVVPMLRQKGVMIDMAACFPWQRNDTGALQLDSFGIFVIGGSAKIVVQNSFSVFECRGGGQPTLAEEAESADADSEVEVVSERLLRFNTGQGYGVDSYLPKGKQLQAVRESLTKSVVLGAIAAAGSALLPICKEKRCDVNIFDPDQLLFRTGAHMPLLLFMGDRSRRSPEALMKREQKQNAKKKGLGKGKGGKQTGDGKLSIAAVAASPALPTLTHATPTIAAKSAVAVPRRRVPPPPPEDDNA